MCSGECSEVTNWAEIFIVVATGSGLCREGFADNGQPALGLRPGWRDRLGPAGCRAVLAAVSGPEALRRSVVTPAGQRIERLQHERSITLLGCCTHCRPPRTPPFEQTS